MNNLYMAIFEEQCNEFQLVVMQTGSTHENATAKAANAIGDVRDDCAFKSATFITVCPNAVSSVTKLNA